MLETMKRLDAHANALLLTGASDIDLLGGMFDVMPEEADIAKAVKQLADQVIEAGAAMTEAGEAYPAAMFSPQASGPP